MVLTEVLYTKLLFLERSLERLFLERWLLLVPLPYCRSYPVTCLTT